MPITSKRMPEMPPTGTEPDAISMGSSAWITSWRSTISSKLRPIASATSSITGPHAIDVVPWASSSDSASSALPNPMISNMVNGLFQVA